MRFAVAALLGGAYMLAAQDTQPWWISISVAVLLGSILLPGETENDW
jgi:hypothetical protein